MKVAQDEITLLPLISKITKDVEQTCETHNINLIVSSTKNVEYNNDGFQVSGYFSEEKRELAIAIDKPVTDWLPIFVHESCHLDQYLEGCEAWKNCIMPCGKEATDLFFEWIAGSDDVEYNIAELAHRSMMVELDCERRTVEKIKKYGLEEIINIEDYTKKANSYVYYYLMALYTRAFYDPNNKPYENESVWSRAPDNFDGNYQVIPVDLARAYLMNYQYLSC